MKHFSFNQAKLGIVIGLGGIGHTLYKKLKESYPHIEIYAVTTNSRYQVVDTQAANLFLIKDYSETSIEQLAKNIQIHNHNQGAQKLDFIINTVGCLSSNTKPEKSIKDFSQSIITDTLLVNTLLTGFIAKYFKSSFNKDHMTLFSTLSAQVGSISDNQLGGWYGYRMSKAALNMLIKNIAIEFNRSFPNLIVNSVHPGTTKTVLSQKYLSSVSHQVLTPEECTMRLIDFYQRLTPNDSGSFFHAKGHRLPY